MSESKMDMRVFFGYKPSAPVARGGAGAGAADSDSDDERPNLAAIWAAEEAELEAEARVEAAKKVAAKSTVVTHVPVRYLQKTGDGKREGPAAADVPKSEIYAMLVRAKEAGSIDLSEVSILTLKRLWMMCAWKEWEPFRRNTPGCNSRIDLELFIKDAVKSGCVFEPTKARNSHLKAWREKYEALLETYADGVNHW